MVEISKNIRSRTVSMDDELINRGVGSETGHLLSTKAYPEMYEIDSHDCNCQHFF